MVSPGAFSASGAVGGYSNFGDSIQVLDTSAHCFVAGLNLPSRAKITAFAAWYVNQSTPSTEYVILRYAQMSDGSTNNIKFLTFDKISGSRAEQSAPISPPAVFDAAHNAYSLLYCTEGSSSNVFYGAHITYTYTNAGD